MADEPQTATEAGGAGAPPLVPPSVMAAGDGEPPRKIRWPYDQQRQSPVEMVRERDEERRRRVIAKVTGR